MIIANKITSFASTKRELASDHQKRQRLRMFTVYVLSCAPFQVRTLEGKREREGGRKSKGVNDGRQGSRANQEHIESERRKILGRGER